MATTEVVAPTAPAAPQAPAEAPAKPGADALGNALAKLKSDLASGTVKFTDDSEPHELTGKLVSNSIDGGKEAAEPEAPEAPAVSAEAQWPQKGTDGKWHNKDGTFAEDPSKKVADALAAKPEETPEVEKPDEEGAEPLIVKLPGRAGAPELEIEVTDPAIVERLNILTKSFERQSQLQERFDRVEQRESALRGIEGMMQVAPDAFVIEHLAPEHQVSAAKALIAQHWDALVPTLAEWAQNGSSREIALAKLETARTKAQREWEQRAASDREAQGLRRAVQALVPESVGDSTAARFMRLAEAELVQYMNDGKQVTRQNVGELLKSLIDDFHFHAAESTPAANGNGQSGTSSTAVQRPAAGAKPAATPGAPTQPADPKKARALAQSRATARRIAPQGAGSIAPEAPKVPKGALLKDAFKFVKENPGMLRATDSNG